MDTVFISKDGSKKLPLNNIKYSLQENNSMVSDAMFTKIMWTFEVAVTNDFIQQLGDYSSTDFSGLQNKIEGFLQIENRVHEAVLYIQKIFNGKITAQIDYGFEELPNFNKKLSELDLDNFDVPDIYTFAKNTLNKSYPATNFNFPRIYTKKYDTSNQIWKNFDGYYNDLKPDGSDMRRNYVDSSTQEIYNINIIHPCPHPLYLLKKVFEDAGYTLAGDILTDPKLLNKWVFSGTEYFTTLAQKKYGILINSFDNYELVFNYRTIVLYGGQTITTPVKYGKFKSEKTIEKTGDYKLLGNITVIHWLNDLHPGYLIIKLNNNIIFQKYFDNNTASIFPMNLDFVVNTPNSVLSVEAYTAIADQGYEVCKIEITGKALEANTDTIESKVVTNLNKIDLRRAVPNMTCGEYVTIHKNWFNYDIDIVNKTVYMNRMGKDKVKKVDDFRMMEIPIDQVERNLLNKKSFLLKVVELDGDHNKNNMYYDFEGPKLNGTAKSDTTTIDINGYLMPLMLPKPQGYNTANVVKDSDSVLSLVEYNGLINSQNNASYSSGCDFPELFDSDWANYLKGRVSGVEYKWSKNVPIELMCNYTIKGYWYCYNNNHIIKSWQKDKISENTYKIEFITETV